MASGHRAGACVERVPRLDGREDARRHLVKGVGVLPMFTGLIGLLLLGAFAAIWLRERVDRTRTAYRCVNHTDRPDFRRPELTAVDTLRRSLRCYIITSEGSRCLGPTTQGAFRHEVVSIEHQTWVARSARCAGSPVCTDVRALPRGRRPGCAGSSIRADAIRSRLRQRLPRAGCGR